MCHKTNVTMTADLMGILNKYIYVELNVKTIQHNHFTSI